MCGVGQGRKNGTWRQRRRRLKFTQSIWKPLRPRAWLESSRHKSRQPPSPQHSSAFSQHGWAQEHWRPAVKHKQPTTLSSNKNPGRLAEVFVHLFVSVAVYNAEPLNSKTMMLNCRSKTNDIHNDMIISQHNLGDPSTYGFLAWMRGCWKHPRQNPSICIQWGNPNKIHLWSRIHSGGNHVYPVIAVLIGLQENSSKISKDGYRNINKRIYQIFVELGQRQTLYVLTVFDSGPNTIKSASK